MTDPNLPTYLTRGHALSQAQLCTELGSELLKLCQSVTEDGRLAPDELEALRHWLGHAEAAQMPAVKYLRVIIERVLADGRITPDEYREVYRAVESVLPFDARQRALQARQQVEAAEGPSADTSASARGMRIGLLVAALVLGAIAIAWLSGWLPRQ